jgi:hypothetical protein
MDAALQDLLASLVAYEPESRGVSRLRLEEGGLRAETDPLVVSEMAVNAITTLVAIEGSALSRELAELYSYRLLFLLLPEECLFGEPKRDRPVIEAHLNTLGVEPHEDLIRGVKFLVDNFRSKTRKEQRKPSITDVYVKYPHQYEDILGRQCGRCATCGVQLVYGNNMQLDHVLPWHLGDDPADGSNWQFLCDLCNRGKGMLPHYALSSLAANWIRPNVQHALGADIRYAALKRDRKCWKTGQGPTQTSLAVEKRRPTGCWILDNVRAVAADTY